MIHGVKLQIVEKVKTRKHSLQINESTYIINPSLVLGLVQYFEDNSSLHDELIYSEKLIYDTIG